MKKALILAVLLASTPAFAQTPAPVSSQAQRAPTQQWATSSSSITSNGTAVATLSAPPGKFVYVTGFEVTASGTAGGNTITPTVTGVAGGTLSYIYIMPAGGGVTIPLVVEFNPPLRSAGRAVSISFPANGAGGTEAVNIHGFIQ